MTSPEPKAYLSSLPLYVPGATKGVGDGPIVKLSSNESALGPSPNAIKAYQEFGNSLQRYPDTSCNFLRDALAEHYRLHPSRIFCGNGSDQIVDSLTRLFAGDGDEVVFCEYGFLRFKLGAIACGATPVVAPEVNCTTSVDAVIAAVTERTKVVLLANPNNPTGTYISKTELARLCAALPSEVLLVIDSAYAEFVFADNYSAGIEFVEDAGNVVMTRTFSKAYGLAGLRLGWAYGPKKIIEVFNRARLPFPVSGAAQAAGVAALHDEAYLQEVITHNTRALHWVADRASKLGVPPLPSVTNFNTCKVGESGSSLALATLEFLADRNILVRPLEPYGLDNYLRVTVGLDRENEKFIDALGTFLNAEAVRG